MGNNHARSVLQSGTADASDLLQGQWGLFLSGKIIPHQNGAFDKCLGSIGLGGPAQVNTESSHQGPHLAFRGC